ncbi:MAG: beta-phosphoglucomutase [Anaerolineae bacterium]
MQGQGWVLVEDRLDPEHFHHYETVFTLGNGYLGTRGTFEEGYPGAWPATLINGLFDDAPLVSTELANCPDWLPLTVFVQGERFRMDRGQVLAYRRRLDLHRALLTREVRWRSPAGHTLDLCWERFASLADPHLLALRCHITPLDFDGPLRVQANIQGYPDNQGLMHWDWVDQGHLDQGDPPGAPSTAWLHLCTRHSAIGLGMAATLAASDRRAEVAACDCHGVPTLTADLEVQEGRGLTLEKLVAVYTSHDVPQPAEAARDRLLAGPGFDELFSAHEAAWERVWQASDVIVEGSQRDQLAIRHSLFQLLIAAPWQEDGVSIPAKTLSGFGYRGHVFWDTEILCLPFFTFTQPEVARNLLTYRYRTLPGARRKAKQRGYEGAMFAWESARTGDEVTPTFVPGPQGDELVRIWTGDKEYHITADVAYAMWQYWQATGDDAWMANVGAPVILETAVFWESCVGYNRQRGRYELKDVIGPDENHERVDNNAFTNCMIQWHLEAALAVLAWLRGHDAERADQVARRLALTPERLRKWADISSRMLVLHDPETGLIEQFEGFFDLEDVDLGAYEPRTRSMQAILGIEGANQVQVLKQADVLMLLYLLRERYDRQTLQVNWDYYNPRTDHSYGSSLSPAIHAILACELGNPEEAYQHFLRAALVDLDDLRGNTADGVHAATAGGVWQALVFGFGGIHLTEDGPVANPHLPAAWTRLKFRLRDHGEWYDFDLGQEASTRESPGRSGEQAPISQPTRLPPPDIRGIIFDLDGVLTDTSEYHYRAWKRLADEEGIPFDRAKNEALRGVSRRDSLMILLGDRPATEQEIQEMMARKNRDYQAFLEDLTPDNRRPRARELLEELRTAGIEIAIGSASKNTQAVLHKLGIEDWFDAVSDGYSVDRQKPAPDLFLHAASQLGLAPAHCVVVEDAESGVEAALAGGMWAVGIGPRERVGAAHVVLPNLDGVHWADLKARLKEAARERQ